MVSILFFATSCEKTFFKKTYSFDSLDIPKSEYVFDFMNESETTDYDVVLMFRYIQGYQFSQVVFNFSLQTETQETISSVIGIPVRNDNGSYLGQGSGDIWDIEQVIMQKCRLPKGKNTFKLIHEMPREKLHYVQEVGIKIVKSKE